MNLKIEIVENWEKIEKSIFSFNFDSTFMKFEHSINELGSKKTCFLNLWFFLFLAARGVKNHNFGRGGYRKKLKNGQKWKNQKIRKQVFFQVYVHVAILCWNFIMLLSKNEWEDRFLVFFQKTFWGQILPKIEHKWPSQPWKSKYKLV